MRYRHIALLLAVSGFTAACGLSGSDDAWPQIRGELGRKPRVTVPDAEPAAEPRIKVLTEGSGRRTAANQVVVTNAEIRVWQGNRGFLNTYDTHQPTTVAFDGRHVSKTWADALTGRKAGSRVMLVSPAAQGFGPWGKPPAGVSPTDSLIVVFDVIGGYPPGAQASPAGIHDPGGRLPQVAVAPGAPPQISARRGSAAPDTLTVRTLAAGSGPAARPGSTIVVQYSGSHWKNGRMFDSSYARGGPNGFELHRKYVLPGWYDALAGQRAGSRVMIVVPPSLRKGFKMTPGGVSAPPGTTAVYVVDILEVHDAKA